MSSASSRRSFRFRRSLSQLHLAANENGSAAANSAIDAGSFTLCQTDGFEVPYGEYPHGVGMQVFDRDAATLMANDLSGLLGKLTRGFRGVPVYAGHPDHHEPSVAAQYGDRRARGWIKQIIPGAESARFVVAYNELGSGEVNDAQWAGYSPFWYLRAVPGSPGKLRPFRLKSMALTNNPNIPVPPLIAANDEPSADSPRIENPPMKPELKNKIILALALAPEATDDDIETALSAHLEKLTAEQKEKKEPEETPPPTPPAANTKLVEDINAAVAAANDQREALRALRIDTVLDSLTDRGIITPASREAERTSLLAAANEQELSTKITALRARRPVVQTQTTIAANLHQERGSLLAANSDQERARLRREAVEAVISEITRFRPRASGDYERASSIAAERNPELFAH